MVEATFGGFGVSALEAFHWVELGWGEVGVVGGWEEVRVGEWRGR